MADSAARVHTRIIEAIRAVPIGCTASYGGVARAAGVPGRARLVGWILRNADVELPWHRIVRADGRSAFPVDSTEWRKQRKLLAAEGVRPGNLGAYPLATAAATDMDMLLWRPAITGTPVDREPRQPPRRAQHAATARIERRKCHH